MRTLAGVAVIFFGPWLALELKDYGCGYWKSLFIACAAVWLASFVFVLLDERVKA